VVFYREDDCWIAHGLEFDLVGHGSTKQESLGLLLKHIRAQVADSFASGNLENLFFPAPGEIFDRFATGTPDDRAVGHVVFESEQLELEGIQAREYLRPTSSDPSLATA